MTKTDLYGSCMAPEVLVIMHQIPRARFSARATSPDLVFVITFRKKLSPGPKNGLESCISRFSTICAKNQVLYLKIVNVTVLRVEQITIPSVPPL
jgi:hypothetical protein